MKIECKQSLPDAAKADILILGMFEGATKLSDKKLLKAALESGDFKGELEQRSLLYTEKNFAAPRVLLVGLGKKDDYSLQSLRRAFGEAVDSLKKISVKRVGVAVETLIAGLNVEHAAQVICETTIIANYKFEEYKPKSTSKPKVTVLSLLCESGEALKKIQAGAKRGKIIGDAVNFTRDLQNQPGNFMTPTKLAAAARRVARDTKLNCRVLGKKEIAEHKMGGLLGVAKGSYEPPRFIILEHNSGVKSRQDTLVFVGKGITFDSGGISIKAGERMEEMKFDMSGAAAVLGVMKAVSELNLAQRIVGLVPAAENLPSSSALKPGDVLTASSGKTIEIINTDAEGRLVLADALTYAKRYKPNAVVDLATLTGGCVIALGHHASGLFGNNEKLIKQLRLAGDACGERLWPLPLWQEYYDDIKSDYADIKNSAGRAGSAITAAAFLGNFTESYPWAHVDIAGTAWTNSKKGYLGVGGTGVGVRLLMEFLHTREKC